MFVPTQLDCHRGAVKNRPRRRFTRLVFLDLMHMSNLYRPQSEIHMSNLYRYSLKYINKKLKFSLTLTRHDVIIDRVGAEALKFVLKMVIHSGFSS